MVSFFNAFGDVFLLTCRCTQGSNHRGQKGTYIFKVHTAYLNRK